MEREQPWDDQAGYSLCSCSKNLIDCFTKKLIVKILWRLPCQKIFREVIFIQVSCGHCSLVAEHRSKLLRTEIESAVKLLARRLGSSRAGRTPLLGMPNIVVSSISSDEEDVLTERQTSSDRGSLQTSETR